MLTTVTAALGDHGPCPADAEDIDSAATVVHYELTAEQTENGGWLYAYNQQNPGPTLHANLGDTIIVDFTNRLGEPSTIHWHGMHVPFEMDGVAWMGAPIADGATFRYEFVATKSGTFWSHPHFNTNAQVEGGLYGAVLVHDPNEPVVDVDLVLFLDDVSEPLEHNQAHGHGAVARDWNVNGVPNPTFRFEGGTTVRARVINVANAAYAALRWPSMEQIGSDQGLLPAARTPDRVVLSPSDRAEFVWRIGEVGFDVISDSYSLNGGDTVMDEVPMMDVTVDSPAPVPAGLAWAHSGDRPNVDPPYSDIVYVLAGSDRTGEWLINGERFPEVTIEEVPLGSTQIIEVRNLSPTEHPFHLHGMSFEVLSVDGEVPEYRVIEDSLNIGIRSVVKLRLEATNPGDWMTHCHILPHAEDGMMTVLRVVE
jgi:FtsP/CotA-like multicopper oxidase with cupredoxin domain